MDSVFPLHEVGYCLLVEKSTAPLVSVFELHNWDKWLFVLLRLKENCSENCSVVSGLENLAANFLHVSDLRLLYLTHFCNFDSKTTDPYPSFNFSALWSLYPLMKERRLAGVTNILRRRTFRPLEQLSQDRARCLQGADAQQCWAVICNPEHRHIRRCISALTPPPQPHLVMSACNYVTLLQHSSVHLWCHWLVMKQHDFCF